MIVKDSNEQNKRGKKIYTTESGERVFYLKIYNAELEDELVDIFENLRLIDPNFSVELIEGTYKVRELPNTHSTAWEILLGRTWPLTNQVYKDDKTGEKYYPIRLSHQYIEPDKKRKLAV